MGFNFLPKSKTITSFEINCAQLKAFKADNSDNTKKTEVILFEKPIIESGEICDYKELKTALKYLAKKGFGSGQNILCVPSNFVFTNVVTLPFYSNDELKAILHQEIPRQIPFDADNAFTDYDILHKDSVKNQAIVLIAAIKNSFAKDIETAFNESGIKLNQISIASLDRINYLKPNNDDENQLLIDFDWQTTDLTVIKNDMPAFSHNILGGKENILKNIASGINYDQTAKIFDEIDLNVEPEDFGDTTQSVQISLNAKNIYSGILSEINQILEFYYSQNESEQRAKSVVITGEGSTIKGIEELVAQKLHLEVVSAENDSFEACKGAADDDRKIKINLLGKKFAQPKIIEDVPQETISKCKKIATYSCSALAAFMFIYLLIFLPSLKMQSDLKSLTNEADRLKPQVEQVKEQSKEFKKRQKIEDLKVIAKDVIDSQIMNWKQVLVDISSSVPSNIKITQIDREQSRDTLDQVQINIKGVIDASETLSPISYFVLNLNNTLGPKSQLTDSTIKSLQFNEQTNQYEFEIQTQIKSNTSTAEGLKNG